MKATIAFASLLLASSALAAPVDGMRRLRRSSRTHSRRAAINCESDPNACPGTGPSGQLVAPVGGTTITQTTSPGGDGLIPFNYSTVNIFPSGGSGPTYFTQNVNISLQGNGQYYHMATLGAEYSGANIISYLITPPGACGTYNLVVQEQQWYESGSSGGEAISFRSAAPQVIINCEGAAGPTVYTVTTTQTQSTSPPPTTTSQSILTGVTLSTPSILTGVTLSTPSILTGVTLSTPSILTGVVQSTTDILTGVVQDTTQITPTPNATS